MTWFFVTKPISMLVFIALLFGKLTVVSSDDSCYSWTLTPAMNVPGLEQQGKPNQYSEDTCKAACIAAGNCENVDWNDWDKTCFFGYNQSVGYKDQNPAVNHWDLTRNCNELGCRILSLNHGILMCEDVSGTCLIFCLPFNEYYDSQSLFFVRCVDGIWKSGVDDKADINPDVFKVETCKRRVPKYVSGTVTVIARSACKPSVDLGFTTDFIQKTLKDDYLPRSAVPLVSNVFVDGCGGKRARTKARKARDLDAIGSNDVRARITISSMDLYDQSDLSIQYRKDQVNSILQSLDSQFKEGFFRLVFMGDSNDRSWYAIPSDIEVNLAVDGCLVGTVNAGDGCDVCPAGMYSDDQVKCLPCQKGKYNPWEAQYECMFCPTGTTPGLGSYTYRQCA